MRGVDSGVSRPFRFALVGLLTVLMVVALAADPADAARHRRKHVRAARDEYNPPTASIVVDANTGKVLEQSNADAQRHPASLTKIMTLYLLFERIQSGKIKLDSELRVSAKAAAQAPSKLGLKPGDTITVDNAIKAIVTKSANDIAVVIAEALAGDEDSFARLMTRKAHALGMSHTGYVNASGLPDDGQITTARDLALLGRAVHDRFPQYFHYFSTPSFTYHGVEMRNHNHLLGRVDGVDGMKTGYVHASGFNLVTSMHRGKRRIVAVVLGGRSAGERDAHMRNLLEHYIAEASPKGSAPVVAEAAEPVVAPGRGTYHTASVPPTMRSSDPTNGTLVPAEPMPGSSDPIKPLLVKTISVKSPALPPPPPAPSHPAPEPKAQTAAAAIAESAPLPPPGARPGVLGVLPVSATTPAQAQAYAAPARTKEVATAEAAPHPTPAAHAPVVHSGWMIQVGAFDVENEAKQRLVSVKNLVKKLLDRADPFTETVVKGDKTYYRARFAGLEKDQAEAACRRLKRKDIACMAIKN